MEHLLGMKSVSELTSLSKATVYRGVKAGTFPNPVRLGAHRIAWRASDIGAWIESREPTRTV
jgi:prophage regulatory protein